jgi:hypothetical protein
MSSASVNVAPDLFTAETPFGTYEGMTNQGILSKPEWLAS